MPCCGQRKIYTESDPVILGIDTGGPARLVLPSVNVMGLRPGKQTWARGSHFDALVGKGWIKPV